MRKYARKSRTGASKGEYGGAGRLGQRLAGEVRASRAGDGEAGMKGMKGMKGELGQRGTLNGDLNGRMLEFVGDAVVGGAAVMAAQAHRERLIESPKRKPVAAARVVAIDVRAGEAIEVVAALFSGITNGLG